jgi:hypothetical protein
MTHLFNAEKDVEVFFRNILQKQTAANFITAKGKGWQTDGIIEWQGPNNTISLLLEAKFNKDLTDVKNRSIVLAQVLYYYNRLKEEGKSLPNFILVGDDAYSFVIPFNSIEFYLDSEVDWSRPPSNPDPELKIELDVFLYKTSELTGLELKLHCENLSQDTVTKTKPSKENLSQMYQYWVDHIFPKDKYSSVERAHIFYNCICYSETDDNCAYLHPTKKNILVIDSKEYQISLSATNGFFDKVQRGLPAIEIDELVSMRDRIIEDDTRRRQGVFYTPTLWVDEANSQIDEVLGETWRDDCIVWDCCAGTGNLTRDYQFANLILSTAELTDIQVIKREDYNEGAQIFQYDFLNPESHSPFFDGTDNVLPLSVKKLLKEGAKNGKRLVFLINPPYAEDGIAGAKGETRKGVASKTLVNNTMPKLGRANRQLYTQFLYQCEQLASHYGFKKKTIGVFCNPNFITSASFFKFRTFWYDRYSYYSGFMFQASHFADVSDRWGITFTIWNEGVTEANQDLPFTLKDTIEESVISLGEKNLYSAKGREASVWVSALSSKPSVIDTPKFSSGLKTKEVLGNDKGMILNSLGIMCNKGNNFVDSTTGVALLSGKPTDKGRCNFDLTIGETWRRTIALFSTRKLVKSSWTNQKDEYLAPQVEKEGYEQWVDDCHVYALLHTSNNMTSMRDVEYKGKAHNIHNHFFWLTRKEALDLYGTNRETRSLYRDAKRNSIPFVLQTKDGVDITPQWRKNGDPYFSSILPDLNLSPLALEILQNLNDLFLESLPLRKQTTHVNEKGTSIKLHLEAWDAGVYQHKKLWYTSPALKAKWELIRLKHSRLANQLQPGVYKYGFLK